MVPSTIFTTDKKKVAPDRALASEFQTTEEKENNIPAG
jgi:hypothetical protein